jgi:hypothetical protein
MIKLLETYRHIYTSIFQFIDKLVNDARAEVAGTEQKVQAFKVPMK